MIREENGYLQGRAFRGIYQCRCDHCNKIGPAGISIEAAEQRAAEKGWVKVPDAHQPEEKPARHYCPACLWRAEK